MALDSDAAAIAASLDEPGCFGVLFDRHATVVFRYLVRRVGVDEAEMLLGEVFRVAFEKRATYDGRATERASVAVRHRDEPASPSSAQRGPADECRRASPRPATAGRRPR